MYNFLAWMEGSTLGHAMRESGPWTYAVVNLSHIIGLAALFGSVLILDLRLLGVWRRLPLAALAGAVVPVSGAALALAVVTGVALLATKATEYADNPFLLVKFPAIALALINVLVLNRSPAWRAKGTRELTRVEERRLAAFGAVSLACWLTAITGGRLIAYW